MRCVRASRPGELGEFLAGLDWLLFFEHPGHPDVVALRASAGVRIACVPMWEWLDEFSPWLPHVDLMIAPTRSCYTLLHRWRERLGLRWDVEYLPWPIDVERFPFRPRVECRTFLFVNGAGGNSSSTVPVRAATAGRGQGSSPRRRGSHLKFPCWSARRPPSCLRFRNTSMCARRGGRFPDLYSDGDVCVQPSRWEGLGLPLLECQASGLPLLATDAPPMNEHQPWRTLACTTTRARVCGPRTFPIHEVSPEEFARASAPCTGRTSPRPAAAPPLCPGKPFVVGRQAPDLGTLEPMIRTIEECPYRTPVEGDGDGESAKCSLIQQITGLHDESLCRVARAPAIIAAGLGSRPRRRSTPSSPHSCMGSPSGSSRRRAPRLRRGQGPRDPEMGGGPARRQSGRGRPVADPRAGGRPVPLPGGRPRFPGQPGLPRAVAFASLSMPPPRSRRDHARFLRPLPRLDEQVG